MLTAYLQWVSIVVVLAFGVTFVPPAWKLLRAILLGFVCALAYNVSITPYAFAENSAIDSAFMGSMYAFILRGIDLLFLRDPPTPLEKVAFVEKMGIWPKWTAPLHSIFNARDLGNPHVIRRIPPFSKSDKTYIPSRGAFLLRRMIIFCFCYLGLEIFSLLTKPSKPGNLAIFSETNERLFTRLHEISREEVVVRIMATFGFYVNVVLFLNAITMFFSILFVGSGLTSPCYWPPAFSSFLEAYTIRQFWGFSWHQWLRKNLEVNSNFVSSSILGIPDGTLLARYAKIMLSFGLSGLLHYISAIATGIPPSQTGTLKYFVSHGLGIMVEDAVQALYRRNISGKPGAWVRLVGYIWVALFLIWTTPWWTYSRIRATVPERDVMPPWKLFTSAIA